jgi:methylthioribose-1-phosphate isomerase
MGTVNPIEWTAQGVRMLDQRRLPDEVVYHTYTDYREVARAIKEMEIRGAPALGVAAAMGVALGIERSPAQTLEELEREFPTICATLAKTRPTAADLFWAIERMKRRFREEAEAARRSSGPDVEAPENLYVGAGPGVQARENPDVGAGGDAQKLDRVRRALVAEALKIHEERKASDRAIGRFGAELLPENGRVMTQCNAGALATAGTGTALGMIRAAVEQGRQLEVLVPETRPYLQGARLTAWELHEDGIPLVLITDNMVGHFLKSGHVGAVVVGADRIAANGDTANKIGTYPMAVLAHEHGVPFYVAAPISTIDLSLASGDEIPIEERAAEEVTHIRGMRIAPEVAAANPAFDVTPARLISAIITERGVARPPYEEALRQLVER